MRILMLSLAAALCLPSLGAAQAQDLAEAIAGELRTRGLVGVLSYMGCARSSSDCERIAGRRWQSPGEHMDLISGLALETGVPLVSPGDSIVAMCQMADRRDDGQRVGYLLTIESVEVDGDHARLELSRECRRDAAGPRSHTWFQRTDLFELQRDERGWRVMGVRLIQIT